MFFKDFIANKKLVVAFITFLLLIFLVLLGTVLSIPKPSVVKIESNLYGGLVYSGDSVDGGMNGQGSLVSNDNSLKIKGSFENNELVNGAVTIKTPTRETTLQGNFHEYGLTDGTIVINEKDLNILKKGTFTNGNLNGIGYIRITQNGEELFKFSGEFIDDLPSYVAEK